MKVGGDGMVPGDPIIPDLGILCVRAGLVLASSIPF